MGDASNSHTSNSHPRSRTPVIGRTGEIEAIIRLLIDERLPLVTLVGPGGVGKTRLALEVASRLAIDMAINVHFVPLAVVRNPELVITTTASAVGVRETGAETLRDRLIAHFARQHSLLVFDNFEHLQSSATIVSELLSSCPELQILVTSRVPLRLHNERIFRVRPLELPEKQNFAELRDLKTIPSLALFMERASSVNSEAELTESNASVIAAICARLDGLPLAIELAAARTQVLSPKELLARLDQSLNLLTGGSRDAPVRQQTLRDTIRWSYDLLDPGEQRLFEKLAVFVGGFTLEAAQALAGNGTEVELLNALDVLVNSSLIETGNAFAEPSRFSMLETIREFGLERLEESGEIDECSACHAEYFAQLAERARPALVQGSEQRVWMKKLESEHSNLRVALNWAVDNASPTTAFRLAVSLDDYWKNREHYHEARRWLEAVLALPNDVAPKPRADACKALSRLLQEQCELERADYLINEAIKLYRQASDASDLALAHVRAGWIALYRGNWARATYQFEEANRIAQGLDDSWLMAIILDGLCAAAERVGDFDRAQTLCLLSRELFIEAGDQTGIIRCTTSLSAFAFTRREFDSARLLLEEALNLALDVGLSDWIPMCVHHLGYLEQELENFPQAQQHFQDSLRSFYWDQGQLMTSASCLEGLASAVAGLGDSERGARLLGIAAATRERIGSPVPPGNRGFIDRTIAKVQSGLDEETFARAEAEGRRWPMHKAIEYALEPADPRQPTPDPSPSPILTRREFEVLHLLADGRSNQEIARTLFVSPHTAATHVANIMNKLGVDSRTAAATWAIRQGIA